MGKITVSDVTIIRKSDLGRDNFVLELAPFSKIRQIKPGQFIHLKLPGSEVYFRRAFSVYDINFGKQSIKILFKVLGRGTAIMAQLRKGDQLNLVGPLGNGFRMPPKKNQIILAAGGVGMPPIYFLAQKLIEKNYDKNKIYCFYGGVSKPDLVEKAKIKKLGVNLMLSTDDGSYGFKGFVTQAIKSTIDLNQIKPSLFACGPVGMLKAVSDMAVGCNLSGQLSLEAPMPCGVGMCLGCILPLTIGGYTRVCRDGPVYNIGEIIL